MLRIVHLTPGSGGTFYCQNCLRDTALVRALRTLGHDVLMTPLYLPMFVDEPAVSAETPVFFGGINVYLQQKIPFFRKTPRWIDRIFDAHWMLKQAAAKESSTNAADLGPMTLSMLRGRNGNQRKEVERLTHWLKQHDPPDVVHISNALLLGLAPEIKAALNVPVVCSLQDEDTWLDAMHPPYNTECWQAMNEAARPVDAFIAVSRYYADCMQERMHLPTEKMNVVYLGIEVYPVEERTYPPDPPTLGYLSRLAPGQGLDRLVDAFIELKRQSRFKSLKLRATGGITPAQSAFLQKIWERLRREGMDGDVEFVEDFSRDKRREFLRSLSLLSVPAPLGESFGGFMLEALSVGTPVVQPAVAAFPEIISETGGGILYNPNEKGAYVRALASLLDDPVRARQLGTAGCAAVHERFTIAAMAQQLETIYTRIVAEKKT
jgi:glycosyltransferase involved in cell wall biosynthesis